ncbi:O-antigen ligase family protein [Erythrobacter insulae]|nr:O-antigen ligase family protein [Erythrobacter insulae]
MMKLQATRHLQPNPNFALIAAALLIVVVGLFGGSSRHDAVQNLALRPLVALFLIPALYFAGGEAMRRGRSLLIILGLLGVWMAVQLVPLPPSFWQSLPMRESIAEMDQLVGLQGTWRPISLAPSRGWNALFSLIVPIVALLLVLSMRLKGRTLLILIAGLAAIDAVFGLLQVSLSGDRLLYLYKITNSGSPVGLFANENHSAIFSVLGLLVLARLGLTSAAFKEPPWARLLYSFAYVLLVLVALVSGSRAGLVAALLALCATAAMAWFARQGSASRPNRIGTVTQSNLPTPTARTLLIVFVALSGAVLAAFFFLEGSPGLTSFVGQNAMEDLRWKIWPILQEMISVFWLLGTGFGSFNEVYYTFEPTELLSPSYVNQAHNDWAQYLIEGGVPAAALFAAFVVWMRKSALCLLSSSKPLFIMCFWLPIFIIIVAASVVDYPLRTPIFQLVFVWLLLALDEDGESQRPSS